MILQSLELKNFKRYKDERIEFPDGLTGIIGTNGSGKSSIVEGIVFALYGVQGTGIDSEFVLSSSANPNEKTRVALTFTIDGYDYTVERIFKKSTKTVHHDAHLYTRSGILADTVNNVLEEITKLVGMNANDFRRTIYAGQDELTNLITSLPSARKEWFLKVVGINTLQDNINSALKERIEAKQKDIIAAEAVISTLNEDELNASINEYQDQIHALTRNARNADHAIIEFIEDLDSIEIGIRAAESEKKTFDERITVVNVKTDMMNTAKAQIDTLYSSISDMSGRISEITLMKDKHDRYIEAEAASKEILSQVIRYTNLESAGNGNTMLICEKKTAVEACDTVISTIPDIKEQIHHAEEILSHEEGMSVAKLGIDEYNIRATECNNIISNNNGRVQTLKKQLDALVVEPVSNDEYSKMMQIALKKTEIKAQLDDLKIKVDDAHNVYSSRYAQWEALKKQRDNLAEMGSNGQCPHCGQRAGEQFMEMVDALTAQAWDMERLKDAAYTEETNLNQAYNDLSTVYYTDIPQFEKILADTAAYHEIKTEISRIEEYTSELMTWLSANRIPNEESILAYMRDLPVIKAKYDRLVQDLSSATDAQARKNQLNDWITSLQNETDQITAEMITLKPAVDRHEEIRDIIQSLKSAYLMYETLPDKQATFESLKAQYVTADSTYALLYREIQDLKDLLLKSTYTADAHAALLTRRKDTQDAITEMTVRLAETEKDISRLKEKIDECKTDLTRYIACVEGKKVLDDDLSTLKLTKTVMKGYIEHLLSIITDGVADEANKIISDITDGRYTQIQITPEYQILVEDSGGMYPVERFSGGEQDVIAIALRIAISKFLTHLHQMHESTVLIFDEIFGSQDIERRSNLFRLMREQESRFPQIMIISHISDVIDEFQSIIQVTRSGKYSHVSLQ